MSDLLHHPAAVILAYVLLVSGAAVGTGRALKSKGDLVRISSKVLVALVFGGLGALGLLPSWFALTVQDFVGWAVVSGGLAVFARRSVEKAWGTVGRITDGFRKRAEEKANGPD